MMIFIYFWRDGVAITPPPGFASLGGAGPPVPALRGPLTRGYSKGALPGECWWELKSLGRGVATA